MTTYDVLPLHADEYPACPSCTAVIQWSAQVWGRGGLQYYYPGVCNCGAWTQETDGQNRPGETWYTYTPTPWGPPADCTLHGNA